MALVARRDEKEEVNPIAGLEDSDQKTQGLLNKGRRWPFLMGLECGGAGVGCKTLQPPGCKERKNAQPRAACL